MYRITFLLGLCLVYGQEEGEQCFKDGAVGTCITLKNCQPAIEDLKNKIYPKQCGFSVLDLVVCCVPRTQPPKPPPPTQQPPPAPTTQREPGATTQKPLGSTTMYVPIHYDSYVYGNDGSTSVEDCEPLSLTITAKKTGRKAWDKCIEYQDMLVYPCQHSAFLGTMNRANNCTHGTAERIVGGGDAFAGEFPHMVSLGFGDSLNALSWLCGGTLISEKFVLTAGHCTFSRNSGPVTHVLIGVLNRIENTDSSKVYKIKNIIKHPDFHSPSKYNDIALLETQKPMTLNAYTVPACLNLGDNNVNDEIAIAIGWGFTEYKGRGSNTLQKVILKKYSQPDCTSKYPATYHMIQGIDVNTQMCYGDKTMSKDTCHGDGGGPLQIKSNKIHCMYTVIGVTSFGKACGFADNPGIYTRVSHYVPWIESIVWPDN